MARLSTCNACSGFIPESESACPNCGARVAPSRSAIVAGILAVAGGGAFAVTLAACYGPPPGYDPCLSYPDRDAAPSYCQPDLAGTRTDMGSPKD